MSHPTYRIPKLTDQEIVAALGRIREALAKTRPFKITAHPTHGNTIQIDPVAPEATAALKYYFDFQSRVIPTFLLVGFSNDSQVISISRKPEQVYDEASLPSDWINSLNNEERSRLGPTLFAQISSLAQKELRCDDLHASMSGAEDSAWNRFRTAQTEVLNSLQQTNQHLLVDSAKAIESSRASEHQKSEELRQQLKKEFEGQQVSLASEYAQKQKALVDREEALAKQLAAFETKESKYVARQEAKKQLDQLKEWLKDSSLTDKTVKKRRSVFVGYAIAITTTGALTAWLSYENVELLKATGANLPQVPWWQWVGLTLKTVVPLAAFTTFLIYFIRWEAAWARQHSDEELRTRARVVDIGRSSWLVEAVRDSQQSEEPIPKELLEQLAKNLFADPTGDSSDLHPKSGPEVLMQQLSSLRLKTPDGAEIEAKTKDGKSKS